VGERIDVWVVIESADRIVKMKISESVVVLGGAQDGIGPPEEQDQRDRPLVNALAAFVNAKR